jgi:hypothetical protein
MKKPGAGSGPGFAQLPEITLLWATSVAMSTHRKLQISDSDRAFCWKRSLGLCRAEYDNKRATLKPRPVHDWTSRASDALRYLAMALDHAVIRKAFSRPLVYSDLAVV